VSTAEHREVAEKFIGACASGDQATLVRTLDPDVTGVIALGPSDPRTGRTFRGSSGVAANLLRYMARATLVWSARWAVRRVCWLSRIGGCGRS
jgi:hypothetical protein